MIDNRKEITTGRYKWVFRSGGEDVRLPEFFREFPLSHEVARILYRRGLTTRAQVSHFLYDTMNDLADPFLMKGMKAAAERIVEARQRGEPVVIYGDYDVDGITSTSILYRFFKRRGVDVGYYIPDRETEGYGLNEPALQHLAEKGYKLLITVDCGIASADVIKKAPSSLDIIVTDHHLPPEVLPEAVAVIDPHQEDCQYPFKELAGCGVAFTLCRAVSLLVDGKDYREDVELAALGTIADVVSLTGENRILVKEGLRRFRRTNIVGIRALLDAAGVVKPGDRNPITVEQVSFGLAPRLNAAGRIAHASKGVELMISTSWEDARRRAEELCAINVERQTIERTINEQALDRLHEIGADQDQVIVLDGKDWNPGVIGIVASRILEIYNRPVLMITVHDGKGKGSCRSIPAFDIFKALQHCSDLLIQMGGHKMAAGFSIEPDKIPAFRKKINEYASRILKPEDFIPVLEIEDVLDLDVLDIPFVRDLGVLEPCGADNPRPLFASRHLKVEYARRIGKDQKHFKCLLRKGSYSVDGVFWNPGDSLSCRSHDMVSVVYRPEIHEWHGEHVQMNLKDIYEEDTPLSLDRDMLVTAFVKLRDIVPVRRPVQDVKDDMEKALHGIFNEKEVHLMLRVFEEISLLKKVTEGTGEYYEYHRAAHKLNLESSRTYCKYRQ